MDGNEELARLWLQSYPIVSSFVGAMIRDRHCAEDVVQEVAAVVSRQFADRPSGAPFAPWVLGIARYQVYSYYRSKSRDRLVFQGEALDMIAKAHGDLAEGLSDRQTALDACTKELSGRNRLAIELRYRDGMSAGAIAEALGLSYGKTTSLLFRIRESLRRCVAARLARIEGCHE